MRPLAGNKTFRKSGQFTSYVWRVFTVADRSLPRALIDSLVAAGFYLEPPREPGEAVNLLRNRQVDLILIDLNSRESGMDICRKIRSIAAAAGIIMLRRGGRPKDDFLALDAGADDCICAPFRFREMVARLGAVLRRNQLQGSPEADPLRLGDLELNVAKRRFRRGGHDVHLSPLEFDLLLFLMRNRGVPLTHAKLLHGVWKEHPSFDPHVLRFYVGLLRRKIEDDPAKPAYILTEPWVGYRFHDPHGSY